ncbi:MAG: 4'-phosphopantetheinyl transferase superfamily protein [Bacteroidales bacterium]|nr:4'-phosphopantetheinyl transferase superfamily protein [Bacteroidales bacterium]
MNVTIQRFDPRERSSTPFPDRVRILELELTPALAEWAETQAVLTPDEIARADRYAIERPRQQFLTVRTVLRLVLGARLGLAPQAVPLSVTPDGKPYLRDGADFHFNVSHTDGLGLIVTAPVPVGIDAEPLRPMPSADGLVERFFALAERVQYRQLPVEQKLPGFFKGWVCKEALLKGVGCGARGLEHCVMDMDPQTPARVLGLTGCAAAMGPHWSLQVWQPTERHLAALALQDHECISENRGLPSPVVCPHSPEERETSRGADQVA